MGGPPAISPILGSSWPVIFSPAVAPAPQKAEIRCGAGGPAGLDPQRVGKEIRGRTCRACHEVHAAPQEHLVRDGVPYGKSNWILKINYTRDPNGGSCEKTCHGALSYDRSKAPTGESPAAP